MTRGRLPVGLAPESSVFALLRAACADDWGRYVGHAFVERVGDGSLPEACFRHYLTQDYLFLIHFSRAYALAVYKSDELADMRQAAATLQALLETEMRLHVTYCARWGLDEAAMAATPEAAANLAYTRFVLDAGMAGDLLDLLVALAPCVVGYAEIGARLLDKAVPNLAGNPYRDWVEMYGGTEYQTVAGAALAQLERVAARRLGEGARRSPRWPGLLRTFRTATLLEIGFWDMGLNPTA